MCSQGDLGAIDEKYDVAISTACGPLDNIVVDTMSTGQKCVEALIKHNIGVATFIGLDKMQKWVPHTKKTITTLVTIYLLFSVFKKKKKISWLLKCFRPLLSES